MARLRARLSSGAGRDREEAFDRKLIAPLVLGSLLNPVNSSMLAVALIPIGLAFGASPADTVWLVSALYLATAVGQPVVGRLVDAYGPRPLYLLGTALVGVAGLLGALAPNLGMLVVARVLIGIGTCAGYPAAMYLIRSEADRTGKDSPTGVLAILSVANQVTAVIGPTLGGLLIDIGGWRSIFTINIPLAIACLILGSLRLPKTPVPLGEDGKRRAVHMDVVGIILFAVMLTSLMLFLMDLQTAHWYLLVITGVAAAGFVLRELRETDPFIDLRLLGGNAPLMATYVRQFLTYTVAYAFLYGYPQWLEASRGLSPSAAGLVVLPMFLTATIVTAVTGRRKAVRSKLLVGSAFQIAACIVLLLMHADSAIWLLAGVALLAGVPQGLNNLANQSALYYQADPHRMGSAAGLLRTFTYLGAMGASVANAAFFEDGANDVGMHELAVFMMVSAALLLVATLVDRSLRLSRLVRRPVTS